MQLLSSLRFDPERKNKILDMNSTTHILDGRALLEEAHALMRNNLSEPLSTAELASYLRVTAKKLERTFRRYGCKLPARFYLDLRLERARQLLRSSRLTVEEVGKSCGFISASHFSRSFRMYAGHSPRDERKRVAVSPLVHRQTVLISDAFYRVENSL